MIKPQFPRLKDTTDVGDYLKSLDENPISKERLLENSERIKARLALSAVGLTGLALILSRLLEIKISLPMFAGVLLAGTGAFVYGQPEQTIEQLPHAPVPAAAAALCGDFNDDIDKGDQICRTPIETNSQVLLEKLPAVSTSDIPRQPKRRTISATLKPSEADPSGLPEQLKMYDDAKRLGTRGHYLKAIALLDELVDRFPNSPLKAEAELSEVEYLTRLQNADAAIPKIRQLLLRPEHHGRKGELTRVLGDLYRKSGRCDVASIVYDQASLLSLSSKDAQAVREGQQICKKTKDFNKKTPTPNKQNVSPDGLI